MATCFENLVKHFEFDIWQLEQMKVQDKVEEENKEKIYERLNMVEDLCIEVLSE